MDYKRLKRLLNQVVVVGKTKKTLFRGSKEFELQVYYTPIKNKIMIINIDGVPITHPKLFIDFSLGDDLQKVLDWVEKNEHDIIYQRTRLEN
jgi:hypothetical protein